MKSLWVVAIASALTACGVPQPRPVPKLPERAPPAAVAPSPGTAYRIDAGRSELRLLVYRAGALGNLGHNHVIVNRSLSGDAHFTGDAPGSSFELSIPATAFSVDEAQLRAAEGADFPGVVPDDAKSGTLHNMTGPALLDAAHFPTLEVRSTRIVRDAAQATATVETRIAGHVASFEVPFALEARDDGTLVASGDVALKQTQLGLTPFSIMLGAIQVRDELRLKFTLVAVPDG